MSPGAGGPDWHLESVVYQVFPDRFASSGLESAARVGDPARLGRASQRTWAGDARRVVRRRPRGVERRLDHIARLGANVLYLTPIFPAGEHAPLRRDDVRPCRSAARRRRGARLARPRRARAAGMRVLGDLTTNHVGLGARVVRRRPERPSNAPEREFFSFDDRPEHGYASWYGVPLAAEARLPSAELRAGSTATPRRSPPGSSRRTRSTGGGSTSPR